MLTITDPNGGTRNFTYNASGQATDFTYPNGYEHVHVTYDPANQETVLTDVQGFKWTYQYRYIGEMSANGKYKVTLQYTPYGQQMPATLGPGTGLGSSTSHELVNIDGNSQLSLSGFQGGIYDSATGLTLLGARWYNSADAAFLTPDPLGNVVGVPQTLNTYGYGWANPMSYPDPTGMSPLASTMETISELQMMVQVEEAIAIATVEFPPAEMVDDSLIVGTLGFEAVETGELAVETAADSSVAVTATEEAGSALSTSIESTTTAEQAATDTVSPESSTAPTSASNSTIRQNYLNGKAAEAQVAQSLPSQGYKILGQQVSVQTAAGRRVVDILAENPEGQLVAFEVKSGNATRSSIQLTKDSIIASTGGKLVGKNAPAALRGMTVILDTIEVNVRR